MSSRMYEAIAIFTDWTKRQAAAPMLVLCMTALLATYIGLALRSFMPASGAVLCASVASVLCLLWWAHSLSLVHPEESLSVRSDVCCGAIPAAFPFLAFIIPGTLLPEFLFGKPGAVRVTFVVLSTIVIFGIFYVLLFSGRFRTMISRLSVRLPPAILIIVACHSIITITLISLRHYYFNSSLGEDTAYYNQTFWSTLHGQFFTGSLTQGRYTNPPVSSEFDVHNSPFLFLILPLYAVYPSFYLLLALRNVALSVSSIPLYLLARERLGSTAAFILVGVYLLSPNILLQSLGPFYPLQFVGPFLIFGFVFFHQERFSLFVLFLLFALSVREEVALTTVLFGGYAVLLRRSWRWVLVPAGLSFVWWYLSTEFVMLNGRIALEDLDEFFKLTAAGYNGILATVVAEPGRFVELIVNRATFDYLYALLKPTSVLSLLGIPSIFMLPTVSINAIIGAFWKPTLSVSMHYSLIATCCLFIAAVDGLARVSSYSYLFGIRRDTFHSGITLLLLPISLLAVKDSILHNNSDDQALFADFMPSSRQATIERILVRLNLDPTASIAAPGILLPHLSTRSNLYYVDRLWRYHSVDPKYIVLDTDRVGLTNRDPHQAQFESLVASFRDGHRHELIFEEAGFEVYKLKEMQPPNAWAIQSPNAATTLLPATER